MDEETDQGLDTTQGRYTRGISEINQQEEAGDVNGASNSDDPSGKYKKDGNWANKVVPQAVTDKVTVLARQKIFSFAKKRGGLVGLISILGLSGGVVASFFGSSSMIINLMENFSLTNDSSSTVMERRFMKMFTYASNGDPICDKSSKNIKCRMGRISNKAITQLSKKGVVAFYPEGTTNTGKRTGYPSKNPSGYTFDVGEGRVENVKVENLVGYLANNPKLASKVLGVKGAFNLRVKVWAGKHITKSFYNKFGLKQDGGIADGKNTKASAKERLTNSMSKLKARIPGVAKLDSVVDGVKTKVDGHLGKAKKAGVGYMLSVAGCISLKAPGYVAGGVAAVQLAQILPVANDVILSPGSKIKASGVLDPSMAATPEDVDTAGTLLTNRTPRSSDGELGSALDSPALQAAAGINTNKVEIEPDYTPGFSYLTNPLVVAARQADKLAEPACNVILSPAAMYSALAVDAAVTVAASATVIGGLVKIAGSIVISQVASTIVKEVAGDAAKQAVTDIAKSDKIPTAAGYDLGTVLGVSGAAWFSAGSMSRLMPTLTEDQIPAFAALQQENEAFKREMDIASLSPFDTSSRYTFLGSIAYNASMFGMQSRVSVSNPLSLFSTAFRFPFASLLPTTKATTNFTQAYCGYAEEFGLTSEGVGGKNATPAINMSGLPCTGITDEQAAMSTEEAIDLIVNEGWLDETKDFPDDATVNDLLSSGYIKSETPMADFIESCGHPETGDYLYNAAGCTVDSTSKSTSDVTSQLSGGGCYEVEDGDDVCVSDSDEFEDTTTEGVSNARALSAISVMLLDFQSLQSINGEDDNDVDTTTEDEDEEVTYEDNTATQTPVAAIADYSAILTANITETPFTITNTLMPAVVTKVSTTSYQYIKGKALLV